MAAFGWKYGKYINNSTIQNCSKLSLSNPKKANQSITIHMNTRGKTYVTKWIQLLYSFLFNYCQTAFKNYWHMTLTPFSTKKTDDWLIHPAAFYSCTIFFELMSYPLVSTAQFEQDGTTTKWDNNPERG